MNDKILKVLKQKEGYVSGEDIAYKFNLSRQALWKHINELRSLGYEIAAVPHLGYQLIEIPDRLYPWEIKDSLNTRTLGKKIFYYQKISSTMDKAWELGEKKVAEGALICSEGQGKGRGRLGRKWVSIKNKGLYLSIILRPDLSFSQIPSITLLSAVAVFKGLKKIANLPLCIKWPNDILIGQKKLSGVLTEVHAEQDRTNFVVVGIGVNVNHTFNELPKNGVSLYSYTKNKIPRCRVLKEIVEEFEVLYEDFKAYGPDSVLDQWRNLSSIWGHFVKVSGVKGTVEGRAMDLDHDGSLLIRNDNGMIEKVVAGDIVKMKE